MNLPSTFADMARERRLIPFIGAGFSKNISPQLPDWDQVLAVCAQLLGYDAGILTSQGDQYQIAEYMFSRRKLEELYAELARKLDGDHDVGQSRCHLLLTELDVSHIFTTNWDSWIEKAFDRQRKRYSKIVTIDDFVHPLPTHRGADLPPIAVAPICKRRTYPQPTVVKYHGDLNNPHTIVFREADYYNRLDFEHPLDVRLRNEIIGKSVLFIGYSFRDFNVRYLWHKIRKSMRSSSGAAHEPRSFFVTHSSSPVARELFAKNNIDTILLDPLDMAGSMATLFETIILAQNGD